MGARLVGFAVVVVFGAVFGAAVAAGVASAEPTPTTSAYDEARCLAERLVYGPAGPALDTAEPAPVTAASVVEHYVDVGRRISGLARDRGAAAASKLWERFRYIRITDALLDPAKRDVTDARLRRIEDLLAAQYAH